MVGAPRRPEKTRRVLAGASVLACALAGACPGSCGREEARRDAEPAPGPAPAPERIARRLLDELDGARVELPRTGAETRDAERAILEVRGAEGFGPEWLAPLAPPDARRHGEGSEPGSRTTHVLCRQVPVVAGRDYRLGARLAVHPGEPGATAGPGGASRIRGAVAAVELDALESGEASPCSPEALERHLVEWRNVPSSREPDGTHRFDLAFTTTPQTRGLAVVVAPDVEMTAGPTPQFVEHEGTEVDVRELTVAMRQAEGLGWDALHARFPADPLTRPAPRGLRLEPDLGRDIRDALVAPPGARACWDVAPTLGEALHAGVGVAWDVSAQDAPAVAFAVRQGDEVLWEAEVEPRDVGWRDVRVALRPSQDPEPLCLETHAAEVDGALWPFWASPELTSPAPTSELPRTVVLVSIDTLRADRLSLYGYDAPTSPVIDRLGAESLVVDRAVSQTGWTLPSHVSMLTGLTPGAHGMSFFDEEHVVHDFGGGFDPTVPTLAQAMREAGYTTHGVVAGPFVHPAFGFDRGFDGFDHSSISSLLNSRQDAPAPHVTDVAERMVDGAGGRPLFLFVHHWDVHFDYIPPLEDLRAVHPDVAALPPAFRAPARSFMRGPIDLSYELLRHASTAEDGEAARRIVEAIPGIPGATELIRLQSSRYDGEVHSVDRYLGVLFDHLRAQGRWDDAVVVVTSDHGEGFFEHGVFSHPRAMHEEGLGIPIVIRAPGRVEPGRRAMAASNVDITPTILDLLGLDPLPGAQGRSLLRDRGEPRLVVGHDGLLDRVQAERWPLRLIVWRRFGEDELFDLEADPRREVDVGDERPAERAALRAALARYALETGRGMHVAVVGTAERTPFTVELTGEVYLGTVYAYGPPESGALTVEESGRRLRLEARPGPGELVALTVLVPDDAEVGCHVEQGGAAAAAGVVIGPEGGALESCDAAGLWREEGEGLPEGLGGEGGRVHLWRTHAGTARARVALPSDTLDQLRALGYIHDGPPDGGAAAAARPDGGGATPPGSRDGGPGR